MRKLILLVHTSLDGFVAGINGELDKFPVGDDNLEFVCQLTQDADAALFGRISYELLNNYWPNRKDNPGSTKSEIAFSNWYNNAVKIIFSKTMQEHSIAKTTIISKNVLDELMKFKQKTGESILIFGSPTISQLLMKHDLIDSYWIFINPIIFGEGIPLFSNLTISKKLKLVSLKQLLNGEIAINYVVDR